MRTPVIRLLLLTFSLAALFSESALSIENNHAKNKVQQLQSQALESDLAYELVRSLTVEVGARLPGTEADIKAVAWAEKKLIALGFDKVYKEPVSVKHWSRIQATANIIAPYQHRLVISALGGSVSTPEQGITAPIYLTKSLETLKVASPDDVMGKIVVIYEGMQKHKTGANYGKAVKKRSQGASIAASKGAVAILIRSVGTSNHRLAHTGMVRYQKDAPKIPAAALSSPDADLIEEIVKADKPVTIKLNLQNQFFEDKTSYNVIGEITGCERPHEIVLASAHLDSWDEGTGALDDGAGVGIVTAAAHLIQSKSSCPKRTIRVVLYAAEEIGLLGAKAYLEAHKEELKDHILATESDFGGGPVWQLQTRFAPNKLGFVDELFRALKPLDIERGHNKAYGGPDISVLKNAGVPVLSLYQDGTDYFDYHHTADDTLDKVNSKHLQQNVAAWVTMLHLVANSDFYFREQPSTREDIAHMKNTNKSL
ncbi:M28 family peptidase [Algicola sagamiensis]|uniref:M28 family peptidase n=1 Tax=Algicola sagamiensis TaxID=163869 RepID=UPI00035D8640|nr:M28 family peptidase [Algicola sagamiensis]